MIQKASIAFRISIRWEVWLIWYGGELKYIFENRYIAKVDRA